MVRSRDKTEEGAADVARCQMFKSDQKIHQIRLPPKIVNRQQQITPGVDLSRWTFGGQFKATVLS